MRDARRAEEADNSQSVQFGVTLFNCIWKYLGGREAETVSEGKRGKHVRERGRGEEFYDKSPQTLQKTEELAAEMAMLPRLPSHNSGHSHQKQTDKKSIPTLFPVMLAQIGGINGHSSHIISIVHLLLRLQPYLIHRDLRPEKQEREK